jgi:hypothetical protein
LDEEMNEMDDTRTAELTAVREVVLNAYPDCVPELLRGETVQALLDSIEPARAAYARVAATVTDQIEPVAVSAPPAVPAGGGSAVVDPGELPAAEKVRRGIAGRSR